LFSEPDLRIEGIGLERTCSAAECDRSDEDDAESRGRCYLSAASVQLHQWRGVPGPNGTALLFVLALSILSVRIEAQQTRY
jgi:hypothetical protein